MTARAKSTPAPVRPATPAGDPARGRAARAPDAAPPRGGRAQDAPPRALLRLYRDAVRRSRAAGRPVSVRFVVDPTGAAAVDGVDEAPRGRTAAAPRTASPPAASLEAYPVEPAAEPDAALRAALDAARARGERRAAEILAGEDMLSADQFARLLGTSRVTVNTRRQRREVLALDGAKRGYRFPAWQVDRDGKPFAALPALYDRLGGSAWAVYRFLVQPHPELDGLTGREALARGRAAQAVAAAESAGRDFR